MMSSSLAPLNHGSRSDTRGAAGRDAVGRVDDDLRGEPEEGRAIVAFEHRCRGEEGNNRPGGGVGVSEPGVEQGRLPGC